MESPIVLFCQMAGIALPNRPKTLIFESKHAADHVFVSWVPGASWIPLQPYFMNRRKALVGIKSVQLAGGEFSWHARCEGFPHHMPGYALSIQGTSEALHCLDYPYGVVQFLWHAAGMDDIFRFVATKDLVVG